MGVYRNRDRDERTPETVWGKRIYKLLNEKHWTQNDLANKSGISPGTLSGWLSNSERKTRSEPKIIGFSKIAETFGVSTDYLLGKNECKTPSREKINQKTGLSDKSILKLYSLIKKKQKSNTSAYKKLFIINYLIENTDNTSLFGNLYDYLFGEYFIKSRNGNELNGALKLVSKINEKEEDSLAFTSIIGEAYLGNVQSDLVRLKDKLKEEKFERDRFNYKKWEKEHKDEINKELFDYMDRKESEENTK